MSAKREEWEEKIRQWESSGLSGAAWCRENDAVYCQFLYWRERILGPTARTFVELTEPNSEDSGIALEVGDATIRLARAFDSATLLNCLKLLAAC